MNGLARIIVENERDTSTVADNGQPVSQVMGDSRGYAEYLRQYELAEDKAKFNADWFGKQGEQCA